MRRIALALALFALFALPAQAHAEAEPGNVGMILLDALVVRPLCVVGSTASTALSIGTMPATWLIGAGDESALYLINAPWRFTSGRVWGRFGDYEDGGDIMGPRT
jgi:hypothetical protein